MYHLLLIFACVSSVCFGEDPIDAEVTEILPEIKNEGEQLIDFIKKNQKTLEEEIVKVSELSTDDMTFKLAEIVKVAMLDLPAIQRGWIASNKEMVLKGAISYVGVIGCLKLIPSKFNVKQNDLIVNFIEKLFKIATNTTLVYSQADNFVEGKTKRLLQDNEIEDIIDTVLATKLEFNDIAETFRQRISTSRSEISPPSKHLFGLYFSTITELTIFGKLHNTIRKYCSTNVNMLPCFILVQSLIELSVAKQLLLIQMMSFFTTSIPYPNIQQDEEVVMIWELLLEKFYSQRKMDTRILKPFFEPLQNTHFKKTIFELCYNDEEYHVIIDYLYSLHSEYSLYRNEVYLCSEIELGGMCRVIEYSDQVVDIYDWKKYAKSFFVPPGLKVTLISHEKIIGPLIGMSVFSHEDKLNKSSSILIEEAKVGEDSRQYVKLCRADTPNQDNVWCEYLIKRNKYIKINDNFNGVAVEKLVVPKSTFVTLTFEVVLNVNDKRAYPNEFRILKGQLIVYGPFTLRKQKQDNISIKSLIIKNSNIDSEKLIIICSQKELQGFCFQHTQENGNFSYEFLPKSIYLPGGTTITLKLKDKIKEDEVLDYGIYKGPLLLEDIPVQKNIVILETDFRYNNIIPIIDKVVPFRYDFSNDPNETNHFTTLKGVAKNKIITPRITLKKWLKKET